MRTEMFDFDLPAELIAQHPVAPRDAARLLVVGERCCEDRLVGDLPAELEPGDLLVFNDTRVIPARLVGRRGEATVEVTLHQPVPRAEATVEDAAGAGSGRVRPAAATCWQGFARPAKRLRIGDRVQFGPELAAEVLAKGEGGEVTLGFALAEAALLERLEAEGQMPLPPYIRRPQGGDPRDRQDYQTLFARRPGAVAAPTAALHFTAPLMSALAGRGIAHAFVTLHVGAGTFLPVKALDTAGHRMHGERFELGPETVAAIERARGAGRRVVAVGTTVLRTLESAADTGGQLLPAAGETRLFITPGFRFRVVDRLLTNFHLPRSTLFMLVAAFAGLERIKAAYGHAIRRGYRFYSYGDACLLTRAAPP
jgi:S-adenosylmethionine:tRNA ribosyltransferase-isomerase